MRLCTLVFLMALYLGSTASAPKVLAQVITPHGVTNGKASQLVFFFDEAEHDTFVQVTNGSNTTGVTVHVQIWAGDGTGDPVNDPCVEVNFADEYTPNDTHGYRLGDVIRNVDQDSGSSSTLLSSEGFIGFVTVTPVISSADRRAIAFNNMFGTLEMTEDDASGFKVNAIGREARSFVTSALLPDGTVLDGVTGGYVLLQPRALKFNFSAGTQDANIAFITFDDDYSGPFGGYSSVPGIAQLDIIILNESEVPTSCQRRFPTCVLDTGLNEIIVPENVSIDPDTGTLCPGNSLSIGWTRVAVTGLGPLSNHFGFTGFEELEQQGGAGWMVAVGDSVFPSPSPTPTPSSMPTPEPSPSPSGGGGGGGGCTFAGPIHTGIAASNALIILLPIFILGLRRVLRKG